MLKEVAADRRAARAVTMARASLSDGQVLRAVNDFFIRQAEENDYLKYDNEEALAA